MKVLLIDDNRLLTDGLKTHLSKQFVVDATHTGRTGLQRAYSGDYDVIILDLNLPDMSGRQVCRTIRQSAISTPILVLSGVSDLENRVDLLDMGADDYMIKPFSLAELKARLGALLRRSAAVDISSTLTVQDLTLDLQRRRATRGGVSVSLRRKEFDILEYLVRNAGRAVTRAMIVDHVWEAGQDAYNNTVDVHIKRLRDKIDRPFKVPLIKTAYGVGYLIEPNAT